jgi:hypothetical protein
MSSFLCSDRHLATLALACARRVGAPETAAAIYKRLYAANLRSLVARYPNAPEASYKPASLQSVCDEELTDAEIEASPLELIKLACCYSYQSCEHDGWQKSRAANDIQRLLAACAIELANSLPAYEAARRSI